ncbi:MAG: hypothetical protein MI723_04715, partial [Caulobacterales bacterium]|nr:hypothetical protein [Caulobacterales bacterium]
MSAPAPGDTKTLLARLWRLSVRPRIGAAAGAGALMALVAGINGGQAAAVRWIGVLIETGASHMLWWGALVALALGAAKGGALYAQVVVTQRLAYKVIEDLQRVMHAAVLRADFARISAEPPGALAAR